MSVAALVASPLLKTALELVLPVVHDVLGGGRMADKALAQIQLKSLEIDGKRIAAQQQVLKSELEGSTLQRNWRPIAMIVFLVILVFQTIIVPIVGVWFPNTLKQDAQLIYEVIQTIKWGLGGYIASRGVEKTVKTYVDGQTRQRTVVEEPEDGLRPPKVPDSVQIHEAPFMKPDR